MTPKVLRAVLLVTANAEHAGGVAVCATFLAPHVFAGTVLVALILATLIIRLVLDMKGLAQELEK